MKKIVFLATTLLMLMMVLVGCNANNHDEIDTLFFNTTQSSSTFNLDRAVGFSIELTNEQLNAVFPSIRLPLIANALYMNDGTLIEVTAIEYEQFTRIRLSEDKLIHTQITVHENPPQISYINGIAVTAFISDGDGYNVSFQADFVLGGITYHIDFFGERKSGKLRMDELVRQIILSEPADLHVLSNPIILENFSHELSISEAYLDPKFGAFVPTYISECFTDISVTRYRHDNRYALRLEMEFYPLGNMTWHISKATAHEFSRIVSVGEWEIPDLQFPSQEATEFFNTTVIEWTWDIVGFPVFLADELTKAVFWACIYRLGGNVEIGIITDDIIINIFAYGIPPRQVWDMLSAMLRT